MTGCPGILRNRNSSDTQLVLYEANNCSFLPSKLRPQAPSFPAAKKAVRLALQGTVKKLRFSSSVSNILCNCLEIVLISLLILR